MTDTTKQSAASKAPSHVAYIVREAKGGKAFWTRIGSAWANADGQGFNIQLDAMPVDGRIVLRNAAESKE